jgi:transposase
MNPYPNKNSILVMNNAKIHHDNEMVNVIERSSCRVLYLPSYSPDYNPIETAFSTVKIWIKRNRDFMETCTDPELGIGINLIESLNFFHRQPKLTPK